MKRHVMLRLPAAFVLLLLGTASAAKDPTAARHETEKALIGPSVLWRDPVDLESRNLFYGPGGKEHEPKGTFRFLSEDTGGSSPKFEIVGDDGTKWKAKLGIEARPE